MRGRWWGEEDCSRVDVGKRKDKTRQDGLRSDVMLRLETLASAMSSVDSSRKIRETAEVEQFGESRFGDGLDVC